MPRPNRSAAQERALAANYLLRLNKSMHPDFVDDPVGALGQVAVDLQQALTFAIQQKEDSHV